MLKFIPMTIDNNMTGNSIDCLFAHMKIHALLVSILISTVCFDTWAELLVKHEFITAASDNKIEFLWSKPEGNGPFPVLVLIHHHRMIELR